MEDTTVRQAEELTHKSMTENEDKNNTDSPAKKPRYKNTVHLWEFLLELLSDERYSSIIAWSRKDYGEFKLKNQEEVARRWGIVKHRAGMNYEKLSRAIRYYYHQGIIQKVPGQRLVYKFGQLPYEYKPRVKRIVKQEIPVIERKPSPVPLDSIKSESKAFLPLTTLTPPPEISYQFPSFLPGLVPPPPPMCSCCVDYRLSSTCPIRTFPPPSPFIFPNTCRYMFNMFNNAPPSPLRAIPVPVITSTPP